MSEQKTPLSCTKVHVDMDRLHAVRTDVLCHISRSRLPGKTADKLPDVVQYGLLIAREGPVIGAVEFDESRLRDVADEMPGGADANRAVVVTMQHQGRH